MKLILPLLALTIFLTSCSTDAPRRRHWAMPGYVSESAETRPVYDHNATRRNLYSPAQGTGPYSRALREGTWRNSGKSAAEQMEDLRNEEKLRALQRQGAPATPAE